MSLEVQLLQRSNNKCELCGSTDGLKMYEVPPQDRSKEDNSIITCKKCLSQIEKKEDLDANHWKPFIKEHVERSARCTGDDVEDVKPAVQ